MNIRTVKIFTAEHFRLAMLRKIKVTQLDAHNFKATSHSRPGKTHSVCLWVEADGRVGSSCECEAGQFSKGRTCYHQLVAVRAINADTRILAALEGERAAA